jgi:hypothetical protein
MCRAGSAPASTPLRTALGTIDASSVAPVASGYWRSLRPFARPVLARIDPLSVTETPHV